MFTYFSTLQLYVSLLNYIPTTNACCWNVDASSELVMTKWRMYLTFHLTPDFDIPISEYPASGEDIAEGCKKNVTVFSLPNIFWMVPWKHMDKSVYHKTGDVDFPGVRYPRLSEGYQKTSSPDFSIFTCESRHPYTSRILILYNITPQTQVETFVSWIAVTNVIHIKGGCNCWYVRYNLLRGQLSEQGKNTWIMWPCEWLVKSG